MDGRPDLLRIQMSLAQLTNVVGDAKQGVLDGLLRPAS